MQIKRQQKGIFVTGLSAVLFGYTPILAIYTYEGGANGITVAFLRSLISLPILFLIIKWQHINMKLSPCQKKQIILTGVFGAAANTVTLYISYSLISVGLATTLHFIYPLLVTMACFVLYKDKFGPFKWAALFLGILGIVFLTEPGSGNHALGIVLSLISGVCHAFYILCLDKTNLKELHFLTLSFYFCLVTSVVAFIFGFATKQIQFTLTPSAWFYIVIVALLVSVGAFSLFQWGVHLIGSANASILSTLEPITSIICGILILGEDMNIFKLLGGFCIVTSVIFVTISLPGKQSQSVEPEGRNPGL